MFQPEDDSEGNSEQQQEQSGGGGASPRHEFAPRTPTGESRVPIEITTIPEAVETEVDGVPAAAPAAEKKGLNVVV